MKHFGSLEWRVAKLERLMYERSMSRGEETNAYKIWKFLMKNGPSTADQIKSIFPPEKHGTVSSNLVGFPKEGVISKNGNLYSANPDYEWDDIGKISRPGLSDFQAALDNTEVDDEVELVPTVNKNASRSRERDSARQVKANLWSFKPEEVKAAIDAGVDVNSRNEKDKLALHVAAASKRSEAAQIVSLLLDNNANPELLSDNLPAICSAVKRGNVEIAKLIANHRGYVPSCRTIKVLINKFGLDSKAIVDELLSIIVPKLNVNDVKNDRTINKYENIVSILLAQTRNNKNLFDIIFNKFKDTISESTDEFGIILRRYVLTEINLFGSVKIATAMAKGEIWPDYRCFSNARWFENVDKSSLNNLFNILKSNYETIYGKVRYPAFLKEDILMLGSYLGQDVEFVRDRKSAEQIKLLSRGEAFKLFADAIKTRDITSIDAIAESGRTDLYSSDFIDQLCELNNTDKKLIRKAIRIIKKSLDAQNYDISKVVSNCKDIYNSKNSYIIEWLFDENENLMLTEFSGKTLRDESAKVYAAHIGDMAPRSGMITHKKKSLSSKSDKRLRALNDLGEILMADGSIRDISYWEDKVSDIFPDLWEDPEVAEFVYDPKYDDSVLATQLRREVNKPDSLKYDF